MSARSLLAGLAATAVVSSALGIATLAPASADPAGTPDANDIVGVGSDTTEDVMDFLADGHAGLAGYNAGRTAADPLLATFKTVGSAQVTLRQGSAPIDRPVGSTAGKNLLYGTTNNPDVTFARSSSGLSSPEANAGLKAFPYALDTLEMAVSASTPSHAPASLSDAQVLDIYKGNVTNWSQVGGQDGTIKPLLPQAGSGTRKFFDSLLSAANGGQPVTYGAGVDQSFHENTDDALKNDANAIAPFSVAKWTLLYKSTVHLESGFSHDRAVYNVVRADDLGKPEIQAVFGENGFICSTEARDVIAAAGFKQLATPAHGGACGEAVTSSTNNFKLNEQVVTATALSVSTAKARAASLVAQVTGSTAPDGTVSFYDGQATLATNVPLVQGQATYDATGLAVGRHDFRAVFTPASGSSFEPSEATKSAAVKTASKITESFPDSVARGQRAQGVVKVVLVDAAKAATGKVKLLRGTKTIATGTLSGGKVTIKLPALAPGKNMLKAVWGGSSVAVGSQKSFTITQK